MKFQLKNEKANHAEALKALQASSSHELNVLKEKLSLVDTAKSSLSEQLRAAIDNLETARTNLITEKRTNLTIQEEKQVCFFACHYFDLCVFRFMDLCVFH